jgi:hypothetical protein
MKRLKTYESFEVPMPEDTNEIISSYGLAMEDIEELFLEFSDMGYIVKIMPNSGLGPYGVDKSAGLMIDVHGDKDSLDISEISSLVANVESNTTRLGLYLDESPRRLNNFRQGGKWTSTIRFILKKK